MARSDDPSRRIALEILSRISSRDAWAEPLLASAFRGNPILDGRDRAFVTEIVYGTLRWRGRIDRVLGTYSNIPLHRIDPGLLDLLRMGVYQILFLDRVPDSAAVDESVELAKTRARNRGAAGFVNALLRRVARERGAIDYPNPDSDPVGHISTTLSHPDWIVRRLADQFDTDDARRICEANNEVPRTFVRVNTLRARREDLICALQSEGVVCGPCTFSPEGIEVMYAPIPIAETDALRKGLLYIQDEASQLISRILAPEPGGQVLDLCAAPGGKATHIAQLMEDRGLIVAVDINPRKLRSLERTTKRMGVTSVRAMAADGTGGLPFGPEPVFDAILVDAPCSGIGTLRRNPERKWRLRPEDIVGLAGLQQRLLLCAARWLKPAGVLVYSTCTLFREENDLVVEAFLAKGGFDLEGVADSLPETCRGLVDEGGMFRTYPEAHGMDGFFAARMRRR